MTTKSSYPFERGNKLIEGPKHTEPYYATLY
jgi:hypothetical protein